MFADEYQWLMQFPVLSFTHSKYHVVLDAAFQVKAGQLLGVVISNGETSVTLSGGTGAGTVNDIPSLQGPYPFEFQVWIHHLPEPEARAMPGATVQVPVPLEQPACAAVYHCLILSPVESSTQR
jgi:hypothetical protein